MGRPAFIGRAIFLGWREAPDRVRGQGIPKCFQRGTGPVLRFVLAERRAVKRDSTSFSQFRVFSGSTGVPAFKSTVKAALKGVSLPHTTLFTRKFLPS
jgi:hypothetical protein